MLPRRRTLAALHEGEEEVVNDEHELEVTSKIQIHRIVDDGGLNVVAKREKCVNPR